MQKKKERLEALKRATSKVDLAKLLGFNVSFFTKTLYMNHIRQLDESASYTTFEIAKRSGGVRTINAPCNELKEIQSKLSILLLDCIDVINSEKKNTSTLSHGFSRRHSIITNAVMHRNQKNVLNLDLMDFFDNINFGRVRGFFIKNRNFELNLEVATAIAKIACYKNSLPQGSPCSPVISNLITHSLDIRLAKLAKTHSATYSRYADDITFSTRKKIFQKELVAKKDGGLIVGKKLNNEIVRAGFKINELKTRVQFKDSRQDVTGLIVNKKVNIKSEYWRKARAMCDALFKTGEYVIRKQSVNDEGITVTNEEDGTINKLGGILSFIDSVDKYNHSVKKTLITTNNKNIKSGRRDYSYLNTREKTYSKFLFFKYFYTNKQPIVLCEGKTDNIYLKSAISSLYQAFPKLGEQSQQNNSYRPLVNFMRYNSKTKYLLNLSGGGNYLKNFVECYANDSSRYKAPIPKNPVILLLDNDSGPRSLIDLLAGNNFTNCPNESDEIRAKVFLHITNNLYLILTPLQHRASSAMEDFFNQKTLNMTLNGKSFNPTNEKCDDSHYGKHVFSTEIVLKKKTEISFELFRPILQALTDVIDDYEDKLRVLRESQ